MKEKQRKDSREYLSEENAPGIERLKTDRQEGQSSIDDRSRVRLGPSRLRPLLESLVTVFVEGKPVGFMVDTGSNIQFLIKAQVLSAIRLI